MFSLFLGALANHLLFSFGGVALMVFAIVEKVRKKDTEAWLFWGAALVCLFIACYGAWVDEHNNASILIVEKADAWSKYNGCAVGMVQAQAEVTEWSNRFADQLAHITGLQTTLTSQQGTVDSLQGTLAKQQAAVTTCVSDLAKAILPIEQHTSLFELGIPEKAPEGQTRHQMLLLTNKEVTPARLRFICAGVSLSSASLIVPGAGAYIGGTQMYGDSTILLSLTTPAWTPTTPIVLTFVAKTGADTSGCGLGAF
jgi:hypothetical protein